MWLSQSLVIGLQAGEKVKADEEVEALSMYNVYQCFLHCHKKCPPLTAETTVSVNPFLQQIKSELAERDDQRLLDGFGYYL